jgi:hypothetical protein
MSKVIEGAALLAGAVAVGATEFALASTGVGIAALPFLTDVMIGLAAGGVAMEAGAIASALTSNRGMNITTRQPAASRQIIYGQQRVGGTIIFSSTTGNTKNIYNLVVVIAGHPCWAIEKTYLDGRRVYWQADNPAHPSSGYLVQNGFGFGGSSAGGTYTGPDGVPYSFNGSAVYGQAAWGTQQGEDGFFFGGLRANDPTWSTTSAGTPYCGGCTYVYLKFYYSASVFPQFPEIRFTIDGKPVYDPRTGETTFSSNAALCCADWLQDPVDGLGMPVNQEQLIAAANICDEQVPLAGGGTEARYAVHHHFDTSTAPSDALAAMLKAMGGRMSVIGGEVHLFPAAWLGPSAAFDESALTAPLQWDSTAAYKDNCNTVTGTYTCPNYPYNVAGDLYDANGWDAEGNIQNNFQFGFQPTSFPQYASDPLHGYAANQWLNEDAGVSAAWTSAATFNLGEVVSYTTTISGSPYSGLWKSLIASNKGNTPIVGSTQWQNVTGTYTLPLEVSYNMVLSIAQAQRLAKIDLLRRRFWGRGTVEMHLSALTMQEMDVMNFTFPLHGWADKPLEITDTTFKVITSESNPGDLPNAPECRISFNVSETSELIYEWQATEELSIYDVPVLTQQSNVPDPPTNVALISSAATALVNPDGVVRQQIEVTWDTPEDGFVTEIQMQYQVTGASAWIDAGDVDVSLNNGFIGPVTPGVMYDVRIRSVRPNGATSIWVEIDGLLAGLVLSILTQDGYGIGSLIGEAYTDGTAAIICNPFTAYIGQLLLPIFPSGSVTLSGLSQQTLYFVYWIDPSVTGGNVTPIATTNKLDFLGKLGYFLIDSIVTPYAAPTGMGTRYAPSSFTDYGNRTTTTPANAYDNNVSTAGYVSASNVSAYLGSHPTKTTVAGGRCVWSGFPIYVVPTGGMNLTVNLSVDIELDGTGSTAGSANVGALISGSTVSMFSGTSTSAQALYTVALPAGLNLNTVTVEVDCFGGTTGPVSSGTLTTSSTVTAGVFEIYAQ